MINLPKRPKGGIFKAEKDEQAIAFKKQFKTLGDLYTSNAQENQGEILIYAHFAANAAGATCTARPENTEIAPDGSLFISFTSGWSSSSDGGPFLRIFKGSDGKAYEYGWIVRLVEDSNNPAAMTFRWKMLAPPAANPPQVELGLLIPTISLLIKLVTSGWLLICLRTNSMQLFLKVALIRKVNP